jgi:hypothetical protein
MTYGKICYGSILVGLLLAACALPGTEDRGREVVSVAVVEDDTLAMSIRGCTGGLKPEAQETSEQVIVTVTGPPPSGDDCLDGVRVRLDDPLGGRTLIDGSTGRTLHVDE